MEDLEVDLSRDGPHSIETARSFESAGAFDVVLENHGAALHVHLHLDDDLSAAAELATANHYVEEGAVRRVPVRVAEDALPVEGRLEVVTGYGSETAYVTVSIEEPDAGRSVRVDEDLGQPRSPEPEPLVDAEHLPLIGLAAVAVLVAALSVALIGDPVVLAGVFVVILGLGIAGALLWRP